ncbi:ROK family transcriptional regulator [Streptomyces corynorhini]|uniref:ROK family transcriptional regulator n=1 Tax=Streptomyces corynorhini TaxID=2282652 RepID=A0A370AZK2_9ACTN|nr:ROK family transcriptional regulator [Streptomyces corynorhini]RDG35087.1 ROK family transcriptional regulator [Streptomyces corynorhini]
MAERDRRTVRDLRRGNRARVVQRLYFDGPLSRQELGPATGLSSGSISNVVAELVAEGLLEEAGVVGSDGGRPRTLLRVAPGGGLLIGIDIGETRVRVELFDLTLTELARTDRLLAQHRYDVERVVEHVRTGVADVLRDARADPERLLGIGIGVPGIIERGGPDGDVVHGPTIGWDTVPFEALLRAALDVPSPVPLFVDNGAKTLGQAEMWFGGGRGTGTAAIVLIGSGIGASVVHGGALTEESGRGSALEWGHTTVRMGGRRCRCGSIGCLETYAGAEALRERWYEAGGPLPDDADDETALAALLAAAFPEPGGAAPDPVAVSLLADTAECLGAALGDLINLFLPERVLLGGWAGLLIGPRLLPEIRRHARAYALAPALARTTIELGRLGPDAVTVGAATLPLAGFLARGGSRPAAAGPASGPASGPVSGAASGPTGGPEPGGVSAPRRWQRAPAPAPAPAAEST